MGPLTQTAIRYMDFVKGKAPRVRDPDFTFATWEELAQLVDTDKFVRVGRHGEAMGWAETVELMHRNIGSVKDYTLRGSTETGDRVFLEMEECVMHEGGRMLFNSVYIFTFDAADRIVRLEFFQQ